VLIEHYSGAFPMWLSPEQIAVIPVSEAFNAYAEKLTAELKDQDLRVSLETGDERLNAKIRNCQNRKIPYMVVVGEREEKEGTVSVRLRDGKQMPSMSFDEFVFYVVRKDKSRSLEL